MNGQGVETQGRGLFSPVEPRSAAGGTRSFSAADSRMTIRSRLVRIDFDQLRTTRPPGARDAAARFPLRLNLFDDAVYPATVERVLPTDSGYALTGRLDDTPLGTITLVVNGSVVAGTVRSPAATYTIRSAGDGLYVIREVDLSQLAPEAEPLSPAPTALEPPWAPRPPRPEAGPPPTPEGAGRLPMARGRPLSEPSREGAPAAVAAAARANADPRLVGPRTDDGSVIDVIAFYTPAARAFAGGTREVEALIDLRVAETNQAYADSDVIQRIDLVFREEVDYVEAGGIQTDLDRLSRTADGFLDEVHALRDVYAADIVHLFEDRDVSDATGIAWGMRDVSHEFESAAFSVSNVRAENILFAHELGHNMGLNHDRFEQEWVGKLAPDHPDSNRPFPFSYGYVNQRMFEPGAAASTEWRTIMAYPWQCYERLSVHCAPILRFSNADQTWDGDPLGVPGDAPSSSITGPSDAQRSLDATRVTVANFRPSDDRARCLYRVTPDSHLALPDGGTVEVQVFARPGCAWTAASDNAFLSVVGGASGAGRGTVRYRVTANPGARRGGTLTIASQTVTVNQIGPNTPGICTRTRQVYEAVVRHRGLDHCWEVTEGHLAIIRRFDIVGRGLTSLRPGDLAGFTNLEELGLYENGLTALPAGLFAASPRLRRISLSSNRLETLPAGIFAGLTELEELRLHRNRLRTLPAGIFSGLVSLKELSLSTNELTVLSRGTLAGLTALEKLTLSYNRLTALPAGAFAGLTRLTTLWLHNNRLAGLPSGTFTGLTDLEDLTLSDNEIASLPVGIFAGLASLERLPIRRNRLTAIPAGAFMGLVSLRELALGQNQLGRLPAGIFAGLVNLEELTFVYNRIAELPADAFAGLANLRDLYLYQNRLTTLPSDAFSDLANLERLLISGNELMELPPGLFGGLKSLSELTLANNPGAPFPMTLRLEHAGGNVGLPGGATVVVGVDSGAPFRMPVNLSAAGGALSATMATVPPGGIESAPLVVTQTGTAPVTVRLGPPPTVPRRFRGVSTHSGPPLVLVGPNQPPEPVGRLADVTLEVGEASATVEVAGAFRDPDGDRLTYGASSSAPAVASVAVAESRLTVTPVALGTATVTVTATDPGGSNTSATQRFEVRVLLPFTDHPIVPGETPVRAVHFTELRRRIDALRSAAGLGRFGWTNPVLRDGVTRVRLVHLTELRSALAAAYAAAGRAAPGWTDPEPVPGATPVKAVHVMELRAAVIALE